MKVTLHVWRQKNRTDPGRLEMFVGVEAHPAMSFLEMLDVLNERLIAEGKEPLAFESDCREGICGSCALMINGKPHGPRRGVTSCQTYMRDFRDGEEIWIEPFRAAAFPVMKDLITDRNAFDRIVQAGGYISA